MGSGNQQLILSAALMHGTGMHLGAWMARDGEASDYLNGAMYKEIAASAEAGKLHALFLAEQITNQEMGAERPAGTLDTATVLSLMAAVTSKIGLVGTASTTYNHPYDVARRFATLDHLSGGRIGWNSVATQNPTVARVFGFKEHPDHEDRYERADEFISIVIQLWESWEKGALVGDKADALFAREELIHEVNHVGKYFDVQKATLPFARSKQGRPVIFQAGASPRGRDQAAKFADAVFTAQHLMEGALEFRGDIRKRVAGYGRTPDSIKVLPGVSLILGATETEARQRKRHLEEVLGAGPHLEKLARRVGLPLDALLDLDQKFPAHLLGPDEEFKGSIGFRRSIVSLAVKEDMTVRELVANYGGGHQQIVGTPEQVADMMQEWQQAGAADGFTLMIDMLPSGVRQVTELLVPELQSRGLFHTEYEHDTLRDSLGLPEVAGIPTAVAVQELVSAND
jgi:FMN-dependent oxidoreductase (nitrilotriacetate monooxygenase family)